MTDKLWKKVKQMDLGNPVITALVGLVIFYIGLKTFSGGMKSMGNMDHLQFFLGNPIYMFIGGIVMTLLWQSSSLSTTAIIALVASGALPLPAALVDLVINRGSSWCKHWYNWYYLVGRTSGFRWNAQR